MSWYFMEFMMPCTLTKFPGPLVEKEAHNITDPPQNSWSAINISLYAEIDRLCVSYQVFIKTEEIIGCFTQTKKES